MTRCAVSVAVILAIAASRVVGSFLTSRRRAEHFSASRVGERFAQGAPGETERRGGDRGAEDVERAHGDLEALAGRAEEAIRRHKTSLEAERRQRMRGHDIDALGDRETRI